MRRLTGLSGLIGAAAVLLAACSGAPTGGGSTSPGASASSRNNTAVAGAGVSKLLVIVLENHSAQQASEQMPHLARLAHQYGRATSWYAVAHPSLPNYLEMTGGSTFGVSDDADPPAHPLSGPSVFGQLAGHGHHVAAYAEDMPSNCAPANENDYAVRHNAWTYFTDPAERQLCRAHDMPSGTTSSGNLRDAVDHGTLPAYAQLIPNVCHDGHDCPLGEADTWLGQWMDVIRSGPDFTSGRLAVVVTFDEDDDNADNHVLTVVAAKQLHHAVVGQKMTHASLAAAPSRMVGLPPLRDAKGSPDLLKAFGLR
ncbi:MAG: alkaline phosphatase family protein [Streptosporangiales bacterium]